MSKYFNTSYLSKMEHYNNKKHLIKYLNFMLIISGIFYMDYFYKNQEINISIQNNNNNTNITFNKSIVISFVTNIEEHEINNFIYDIQTEIKNINPNINISTKKNKLNITTNIIINNISNEKDINTILEMIHHDENIILEVI